MKLESPPLRCEAIERNAGAQILPLSSLGGEKIARFELVRRARSADRAGASGVDQDPIIDNSQDEVIAHFEGYASVHEVVRYRDQKHLRSILDTEVLQAAETMYSELKPRAVSY